MAVSLNKLAQAVDEYYKTREARLALDKEAAAMKKKETELKEFLVQNISKSDATGVCGKLMRATVKPKVEPTAEDWSKIWPYITKNKAYDLVQKRLSTPAVHERWDDGKELPGVGRIQVIDISLTKL